MSGGLDSAVAAALLVEQGYDVIGITIKTYRYEDVGGAIGGDTSCCSIDGINDARRVARTLGIPHYVYDLTERFRTDVIDDFIGAYLSGATPNPCVVCNRQIKWDEVLRRADALGADFIATGHYARIDRDSLTGAVRLLRSVDRSKDQSYALWGVRAEHLRRTIFPLGTLEKSETREIARSLNLPVASKGESYEICFIPDDDYKRFLNDNVNGLRGRVADGPIVRDGQVVGTHAGYPFYTVGQRRGLGIAAPEPLFVIDLDPGSNSVIIGSSGELMHRGLRAGRVNLIGCGDLAAPRRLTVRIRYKDPGAAALCVVAPDGTMEIVFDEPRRAITRGQSVVLYDGDEVVGGGIIDEWFDP